MENKNNLPNSYSGNSLAVRLIVPTVLAVLVTLSVVGGLGYKISEQIYNYQTVETLSNNLKLSHGALEEGWRNTTGAAMRTPELLQTYTGDVMEGRLDLLGFPEHSGIMIVDSYTGLILQTYPRSEAPLEKGIITEAIKQPAETLTTTPLTEGGFMSSLSFAPLGLHIIAFNKQGFEQTSTAPLMRITIFSTLALTAVMLILLMFGLLNYSVIRPLKNMRKNIQDIVKKDNFHHQMPNDHGAKELKELTGQFNTLISFIEERDTALKTHNEQLEDLVEARTKELKETQEKLVLGERLAAIGEFASSVAHELRNPLSSIKMGVEKIKDLEQIQGNDRRRLELIEKEVDRLSSMLKGILSFASPSPVQLSTFDLNDVLEELTPIFAGLAKHENVRFIQNEKTPKQTIKADSDKVKQALINCVKNACEAAPENSDVRLDASIGEKACLIHITNGGNPIDPIVLARLFEPFFTTKTEGTGLGLPTTKRLLNEMGGDIIMKSDATSGTVCTIKLPIQ